MENFENMPRPEIVLVADTVAREKNIDREDVFVAMEVAIQKAGRTKYGFEHDIRATIDRKTGAISLARYREVVPDDAIIENEAAQITLKDAKCYDRNLKVGDFIIDSLPPIDFGRIAAQTAKQVIMQKVREAERNKQFEEYKEKIGTIINGTVKRIEFGNVILDIGKTEAVLRHDEIIQKNLKTVIVCALMCWMCVVRLKDRKFSCHALVLNLWLNCLRKKCRKFMMVLCKLWAWLATLAQKLKSPFAPPIKQLIRLELALVCAVSACRQW